MTRLTVTESILYNIYIITQIWIFVIPEMLLTPSTSAVRTLWLEHRQPDSGFNSRRCQRLTEYTRSYVLIKSGRSQIPCSGYSALFCTSLDLDNIFLHFRYVPKLRRWKQMATLVGHSIRNSSEAQVYH